MNLCVYGCGEIAIHQFKDGRWCCGEYSNQCKKVKEKIKESWIVNPPRLGRKNCKETNKKISEKIKKLWEDQNSIYNSLESREKQSKAQKNIIHTEQWNLKISKSLKGREKSKLHKEKLRESNKESYNRNPELRNEVKNRMLNGQALRMLSINPTERLQKVRKTHEKKGSWIKIEDISNLSLYYRLVAKFTNISMREKYSKEELKERGNNKERRNKQLDHIFSIHEGFKYGILPLIIGSKSNIELVDCSYNRSKHSKCDISLDELFKRYEKEKIK